MTRRFRQLVGVALAIGLLASAHAGLIMLGGARYTAASSSSDFAARCAATGVVRCVDFDDDTYFATGAGGTQGAFGDHYGYIPPSGTSDYTRVTRDTSTYADGVSSLRFTIPSNVGADTSGAWFTNFTDDQSVEIGEGGDIYVQWRQRFSTDYLGTTYYQADGTTPAGGWKLADVSAGDPATCSSGATGTCATSCWDFETVVQNVDQTQLPRMYTNCSGAFPYQPLQGYTTNVTVQNVVECLYPDYTAPPCMPLYANEWMTFQVHIHVGTWNTWSSTIQLWVGREGEASTLVIDCSPTVTNKCINGVDSSADNGWYLHNSDTTYKIGKVWLLPYHTNKGATQTTPVAYTWYDDLIISTQEIADPNGTPP